MDSKQKKLALKSTDKLTLDGSTVHSNYMLFLTYLFSLIQLDKNYRDCRYNFHKEDYYRETKKKEYMSNKYISTCIFHHSFLKLSDLNTNKVIYWKNYYVYSLRSLQEKAKRQKGNQPQPSVHIPNKIPEDGSCYKVCDKRSCQSRSDKSSGSEHSGQQSKTSKVNYTDSERKYKSYSTEDSGTEDEIKGPVGSTGQFEASMDNSKQSEHTVKSRGIESGETCQERPCYSSADFASKDSHSSNTCEEVKEKVSELVREFAKQEECEGSGMSRLLKDFIETERLVEKLSNMSRSDATPPLRERIRSQLPVPSKMIPTKDSLRESKKSDTLRQGESKIPIPISVTEKKKVADKKKPFKKLALPKPPVAKSKIDKKSMFAKALPPKSKETPSIESLLKSDYPRTSIRQLTKRQSVKPETKGQPETEDQKRKVQFSEAKKAFKAFTDQDFIDSYNPELVKTVYAAQIKVLS